jgi:hypothetical protein
MDNKAIGNGTICYLPDPTMLELSYPLSCFIFVPDAIPAIIGMTEFPRGVVPSSLSVT